tara:strand:- start:578 stop:1375 length:798 start_codon:yes stop_codon:yes gene_type:complete
MNKEKVLLGLGALITADLLYRGVKYCYDLFYNDTTYIKDECDILNKGMIICYSTPNYEPLTKIFLKSLSDINIKCINHFIDSPLKSFTETGFQTTLWHLCVRNKIEHLINVLSNYERLHNTKYFIFSDCDIIYIKKNAHEWYNLERYIIQNNSKDIFFMRENTSNQVNTGFFIIKNNENIQDIISFFKGVVEILDNSNKEDIPFGDQSIINDKLSNINYGVIPNDYVVWGSQIYNKEKSLFHHAVCATDVNDKILQINDIKSHFN